MSPIVLALLNEQLAFVLKKRRAFEVISFLLCEIVGLGLNFPNPIPRVLFWTGNFKLRSISASTSENNLVAFQTLVKLVLRTTRDLYNSLVSVEFYKSSHFTHCILS